jgi:hypothetical protein
MLYKTCDTHVIIIYNERPNENWDIPRETVV